jgi:hypothetical protein
MAREDLWGRGLGFARKFSLTPPASGRRFRVELAKARAAERRAARRLERVLDGRSSAGAKERRADPLDLVRVWSSPGMLDLRRGLDEQAEESFRARLEAYMAGELGQEAWVKTVSLIAEAKRAADRFEETRPRKWAQTFSRAEW